MLESLSQRDNSSSSADRFKILSPHFPFYQIGVIGDNTRIISTQMLLFFPHGWLISRALKSDTEGKYKESMPVETVRKVLIIDDDVDFQFMVGTMLRNTGYLVRSVLEGKASIAITLARECDIILLDIELPGISGVDLGKQLKSSPDTAGIPIILISGHNECEKLFVESEANDFVQKPFSLSALMAKIHDLIDNATDFTRQKMAIAVSDKHDFNPLNSSKAK